MMIYVLNGPILTSFGLYRYKKISLKQAKEILKNNNYYSAVGHEATAVLLSALLETEISYNRIAITMHTGDVAVVFHLLTRLPEGQVLDIKELYAKDYVFGLLKRLE